MAVTSDHERMAARRRLGAEVRAMREQAGLTGQSVASALGWSQAKVSRIEQARTRAEVDDVADLVEALGASSAEQTRLLALAEEAAGPADSWRNSSRTGLTRRQQNFIAYEAAALSIRHYQPVLVPGAFQTPEYARAVVRMTANPNAERQIDQRMKRQAIITAGDGPTYEVVLLDAVTRWCPGPAEVLAGQLDRLADLAELPNVDLRVVPLDRPQTSFLAHPVVIYDFGDAAPAEALVETTTQEVRVSGDALAVLDRRITRVAAAAMTHAESVTYVRARARSLLPTDPKEAP
jgi:transcriptional regulator with XRE-family HTH domain